MHNFFIKSTAFFYMFRAQHVEECNRFNKETVHQVGKQDYILLRYTVNNTLKYA